MKKHNPVNSFIGRKYSTKESCVKAIQELKQMIDTQKSLAYQELTTKNKTS